MRFVIVSILVFCFCNMYTQGISNVDFKANANAIEISYDYTKPDTGTYVIEVYLISETRQSIKAKHISGDIYPNENGIGKKILWSIQNENIMLNGKFQLQLQLKAFRYKLNKMCLVTSSYNFGKDYRKCDCFRNSMTVIERFIDNQVFRYGKFTFEIYENENIIFDIKLLKYKVLGPEAIFYSVITPGIGTIKVTYGEKGWGRFTCFMLSSGLAIGSGVYSKMQYENYLSANRISEINRFYRLSNLSHKIALITCSISASIYLYDLIWVFNNGLKNLNMSKVIVKKSSNKSINRINNEY